MSLDDELHRIFTDDRLDLPVRHDAEAAVVAGARRRRRRRIAITAVGGFTMVAALATTTLALSGIGGPESLPMAADPAALAVTTTTAPPPPATTTPGTIAAPPGAVTSGRATITNQKPPPSSGSKSPAPSPKQVIGPSGYAGLRLGMPADTAEASGPIVPNAQPVSSSGCKGYDYRGSPNQPDHYSVLISNTYGVARIAGRSDAATPEGIAVGAPESDLKRTYPTQSDSHGAVGEWIVPVPGNAAAQYWFIIRNQAVAEIRLELTTQDCYA